MRLQCLLARLFQGEEEVQPSVLSQFCAVDRNGGVVPIAGVRLCPHIAANFVADKEGSALFAAQALGHGCECGCECGCGCFFFLLDFFVVVFGVGLNFGEQFVVSCLVLK